MNNKTVVTNTGAKPDEIALLKLEMAKCGPLNRYSRREAENLIGMMERFNHEIETTHLPSDPKSRAYVEKQWRGRLVIFGQIARSIIEQNALSSQPSGKGGIGR